ncbi:fungal-specific transcription factor domain-containing protein [Dactylonectria estremocensis]|uniref:Fungal-specific transcription factor domain-containing protein n=1 Tax=Dactylonectria estremocensis TaxID=1079267 RepID=A0A9P9DWT3_9HYPO|nr:fungal-specific transcription factor domain-containing protein [Dactylonectria estremocensis]
MSAQRESTKCPLACEYCRIKKAKCSGTHPCGNCTDHNEPCVFPERRRRSRKRKEREQDMEDRLARMEVLLRTAAQPSLAESRCEPSDSTVESIAVAYQDQWSQSPRQEPDSVPSEGLEDLNSPPRPLQDDELQAILPSPCQEMALVFSTATGLSPMIDPRLELSEPISTTAHKAPLINEESTQERLHMPVSPPSTAAPDDCGPDTTAEQENSDPQGCPSYLSICTFPAAEWISRQVGKPEFLASARRLSKEVMKGERLERVISPERAPEPDKETALKWTKAYFDSCLDSVFETTDRHEFERRLDVHFKGDANSTSNKSWYALRNIIYASGCRYSLSEASSPTAFTESRAQSWKYFENALSVHTDLLYVHTDLTSIQALVIMAFHAEALGTPALEYMLVSSATRLAQSKGLHLAPPPSLPESCEEALARQSLWWTLYSYEKHLAYRSGRPSAIDDDYISCPIPTTLKRGSTVSLEFVSKTIAIAQISSAVAKRLHTAKAMKQPPETLLETVQDLDNQLKLWRECLGPLFRARAPFKTHGLPPGTQVYHILYLHCTYYALVIAVHGVFCYPWNRPDLQASTDPEIHTQIRRSTEAVADASRQIILAAQRLEITATVPVWMTFYFPLVGLINMFICVLKNPLGSSTASDLSLMDIIVGHFGYLEFISSSEMEFPFPREIASYARNLVKQARGGTTEDLREPSNTKPRDTQSDLVPVVNPSEMPPLDVVLGLEDWCTFFPAFPQMGSLPFTGIFESDENQGLENNPLSFSQR